MAKQAETVFKERVLKRLNKIRTAFPEKIQQVGKIGTPDILMCMSGLFVAIETKTDRGRLSAIQEYKLSKVTKCGGIAIVMTPKNFEKYCEILEELAVINQSPEREIWR